jgi:ankyrin repeat protein
LLVEAGADINLKTGTGTSPLHAAVMSSRLDLVKYIVSKGGDPKATFGFNQNLIMLFAAFGKSPDDKIDFFISMEEATIKAGNKVPAKIKENQNPALYTSTSEMLNYLLSLGFDVNEERDVLMPANMPNAEAFNKTSLKGKVKQSAVSVAFNLGYANADVLAALLSKGAKIDKKEFTVYFKTKRFPTVRIAAGDMVLLAVKSGNIELMKTIVANTKVNINKGYNGVFVQELDVKMENLTPLMIAAANNDRAMCEYLVSIGARGMPMAKINLPPGSKLSAAYVLKAASYAEDFATDEELKKYLKSLTK